MGGARAGKLPGENAGYKAQFRHVWRKRFEHLHPDARELALNEEWRRYKRGGKPYWFGA